MKPPPFAYHAPDSLQEALALLAEHGDEAKLLAGGQSLIPLMKLRLAEPADLVDLSRIEELRGIRVEEGRRLVIGAMTREAELGSSPAIAEHAPLLAEASAVIADPLVRNMGTIGGSLAHADPAGDMPAVILALEAEMVARGPNGERRIPAGEFFVGMLTSALEPDEILTEIRIPLPPANTGGAYMKFDHPASHYALTGVAAAVKLDGGGNVESVKVGVTGVGPKAYRATAVEEALVGKGADAIADAASHAADGIDCNEDIHASAEYRAHLATVFARRALQAAFSRANG